MNKFIKTGLGIFYSLLSIVVILIIFFFLTIQKSDEITNDYLASNSIDYAVMYVLSFSTVVIVMRIIARFFIKASIRIFIDIATLLTLLISFVLFHLLYIHSYFVYNFSNRATLVIVSIVAFPLFIDACLRIIKLLLIRFITANKDEDNKK